MEGKKKNGKKEKNKNKKNERNYKRLKSVKKKIEWVSGKAKEKKGKRMKHDKERKWGNEKEKVQTENIWQTLIRKKRMKKELIKGRKEKTIIKELLGTMNAGEDGKKWKTQWKKE